MSQSPLQPPPPSHDYPIQGLFRLFSLTSDRPTILKRPARLFAHRVFYDNRTYEYVAPTPPDLYDQTTAQCAWDFREEQPPMDLTITLQRGTRVRATDTRGIVQAGDTGTVEAAWAKPIPAIRWDNNSLTPFHRKRLEIIQ